MSVLVPRGFVASGVAAGIKAEGGLDLALVASESSRPLASAGVFTANLAAAAPVQVCRQHLVRSGGMTAAVVVNSGCANAATGAQGIDTAERTCELAAAGLAVASEQVLVCSTGTIGPQLDPAKLAAALPGLIGSRGRSEACAVAAAQAMLTTDTAPKQVVIHSEGFVVGGTAKGAAMLAPNMATMLALLTTDAAAPPDVLRPALLAAVRGSFNEMTVDGCMSTNDSVIVLASGLGREASEDALTEAFGAACADLAEQMVADAEGGTKVVRVVVTGALDSDSARRGARRVCESQLVKSSWYGEDANWGRLVSELGSAGIAFDPACVEISYGGVTVCRDGVAVDHDAAALAAVLAAKRIEVVCELNLGPGSASMLSADLTPAYVELNMGRS